MHCFLCLFRISSLDKVFSGCIRQSFFIWETKNVVTGCLDRWLSYAVTIARKFVWSDSTLIILDQCSSYRGGRLNGFSCNTLRVVLFCLMERWVQIFKCIVFHSSAKSLVPSLHKFTIQNLDLILFPFLGNYIRLTLLCT